MTSWTRVALLLLVGCGKGSSDSDSGATTGAGTTPTTTPTEACVSPKEGPWSMNGTCFGMAMYATLTVKPDGCKFTFSDWNMAMSVPEGGEVTDTDVALSGPGWDDCTGVINGPGRSIEGVCGDGCGFDMVFEG